MLIRGALAAVTLIAAVAGSTFVASAAGVRAVTAGAGAVLPAKAISASTK